MKLHNLIMIGCIITAVTALSPNAFAQTSLNDVQGAITQGAQFDDARKLIDRRRQDAEDRAIVDGEPGVFILKKAKIFTVGISAGGGYSSNPGRTLDTSNESAFANVALRAGVNTIVAQTYDVGLNIAVSAVEYDDTLGPSSRSAVTNAFIGRGVWDNRIYVSGSVVAGVNANEKLKQGRAFYGTSINASYVHKLSNNILLRPSVSASRQWSGESEQNNISATASAELIWQIAPKWTMSTQLAYTHKAYDNFFEDVTFVKRKDGNIQAGFRVTRKIADKVNISVSYDYTTQDSTFFLSEYESHDGGINLQISKKF